MSHPERHKVMLRTTEQALAAAQTLGLDRLDAQLLLLQALGKSEIDRAWLLAHDVDAVIDDVTRQFDSLAQRRVVGEPLAYIVGYKEFFGLKLQVDPRVLIPRPDTETLVNWSLDLLQSGALPADAAILDLGTGSGAIALAIAQQLKTAGRPARVTATDASEDALAVARKNAQGLELEVVLISSNWFEKIDEHFYLIATNPPYVATADPHLADLAYEPLNALTAGADGLDDLRQIIAQAPAHLDPTGWLLMEHGFEQASAVRELLTQRGFIQVQSRLDLAGIERCSGGQWQG